MKNLFLLITLFLFSISAFANMKVGDTATYNIQVSGMTIIQTRTVTAISGNKIQVLDESELNGEKNSELTWEDEQDLVSAETGAFLVENCSQVDGELQNVKTEAGKFKTCKIYSEDGQDSANVGPVPFGYVILNGQSDYGPLEARLIRYAHGQ